jgi:hypothetical protein
LGNAVFADAILKAERYTLPVIFSKRYWSGAVEARLAAFMVINEAGWILTSWHLMADFVIFDQHTQEMRAYQSQVTQIRSSGQLSEREKERQVKRLRAEPGWITNLSYFWGQSGVPTPRTFFRDELADIALLKLDSLDTSQIREYPVFKNPATGLPVGTLLCRLGFPFHAVKTDFDPGTGNFNVAPGVLPVPFFPLEGMHTRVAQVVDASTGRQAKFVETSSPGLGGQSGGPIFDSEGNVWAMQSRTMHLPLGFSPKVKEANREVVEHQFLNLGLGAHVEEIIRILRANRVSFRMS